MFFIHFSLLFVRISRYIFLFLTEVKKNLFPCANLCSVIKVSSITIQSYLNYISFSVIGSEKMRVEKKSLIFKWIKWFLEEQFRVLSNADYMWLVVQVVWCVTINFRAEKEGKPLDLCRNFQNTSTTLRRYIAISIFTQFWFGYHAHL